MKMLKKIVATICSLTMVASMAVNVCAATSVTNPLSLELTDNGDNTMTVDIKTTVEEMRTFTAYLNVPKALVPYIDSWTWSTDIPESSLNPIVYEYEYKTGSNTKVADNYILASLAGASSAAFTVPDDGIVLSIKLQLVEGGIPENVLVADRTLTLGGEYVKKLAQLGATSYSAGSTTYYLYRADHWGATKAYTEMDHFVYDPTAEGNYVVVPTAKVEEDDNTVAFEGFAGTDEAGEYDGSDAVATKKTFTTKTDAPTQINWTVNLKAGGKGTYTSTVDATGGAEFTLGLVINGLVADLVDTIEAVLQ